MDRTKLIVLLAVLLTMALCLAIFVVDQERKLASDPQGTTQGTTDNQTVNENPL